MSTAEKNSRTPLYTGLGVVALAVIGGGTAMVTTASNHDTASSTVASDTSASPEASTTPSASASSSLFASPSGEADASTEASPVASDSPSTEATISPSPNSSVNAEAPASTAEATAGAAVAPEVATPNTSAPVTTDDQMVTGHENQVSAPSTEAPVTGHEIVVPEAGVHPEDQMVTGVTPVAPTPSYSTEISTQSDAYGNPLDPAHTQVLSAVVYEHVVVAGDTVSHLATLYGTSIEAIAQYNGLANADMIEVGQVLYVPTVSVG